MASIRFSAKFDAFFNRISDCLYPCNYREVPISEASVVIAISSVHRKDSLEAVQYCIDTLKATVPIWKKVQLQNNIYTKFDLCKQEDRNSS